MITERKYPPGPRGAPVFGSLLSLGKQPHLAIHRIARQYGDICLLRLGGVPTVIISHPDLLKEAFDQSELADRWVGQIMGMLSHFGQDLVMAPYGEHWRQLQRFSNRELLSLRNLQQIRERYIEEAINNLVAEVGRRSDAGEPVSPMELLFRSNSVIMFRAMFGRSSNDTSQFEAQQDELLDFVFWAFHNASAANPADYLPWLRFLPNSMVGETRRQIVIRDRIFGSLVNSVRDRPELDLEQPTCLIEVMLAKEKAGEITEETIILLTIDLLLAGIDTSGQTVTWLLLALANRPFLQEKVHQELDRVVGPDRLPTVEDREQLPYLNAAILEGMRYRTVGPLALPHKASKTCQVGGYTIDEGTQVLGNLYSIHHDPRFWESPDEYRPERFLPLEDGSPGPGQSSNAFLPFGVGHRACPGRRFGEVLVWLHASRLLHRYRFQIADPSVNWLPEDEEFGLTISPKPFALQAVRR